MGLEIISGRVVAAGATETVLTMSGNDSATIRNFDTSKKAYILNTWTLSQGAGIWKIRSPRMHDNVQGLRFRTQVALPYPLMHPNYPQAVLPQDNLLLSLSGSAVAGDFDLAAMLIYYEDISGSNGRFMKASDVKPKIRNLMSVEVTTSGGAGGGYTGAAALNSSFDLFKANTDYALLGEVHTVNCGAVTLYGPDTGNLRIGCPGLLVLKPFTSHWYLDISEDTGLPTIPIINSANKAGTFAEVLSDENSLAPVTNFIFAELA
jgi:hypothetical protein